MLSWDPEEEWLILRELRAHRARGEWFHSNAASLAIVQALLVHNLEREIAK